MVEKRLTDSKGNYTFFTVYGPTGFCFESLSYDKAKDALDTAFKEHQRLHGSKWSEGKKTPRFTGGIVKRTGHKEVVMPYFPLEREEQNDDYFAEEEQ